MMDIMLEERRIVIQGSLLRYRVRPGREGADAVVFLHGWRSEGAAWSTLLPHLEEISQSLYFPDLPGFGGSELGTAIHNLGGYEEVVRGFMEKLGLTEAVVVGHSFGGRIAIRLASDHPELVRKLVLTGSAGFRDDSFRKKAFGILARLVKPFFYLPFLAPLRVRLYRIIGAEDYVATPELREVFVRTIEEDLSMRLSKTKAPTLLIWGNDDAETPLEFGKRMRAAISDSRLEILQGAGHFAFVDRPEQFAKLCKEFIT